MLEQLKRGKTYRSDAGVNYCENCGKRVKKGRRLCPECDLRERIMTE
jgi:uncharacterized OB-fold protein